SGAGLQLSEKTWRTKARAGGKTRRISTTPRRENQEAQRGSAFEAAQGRRLSLVRANEASAPGRDREPQARVPLPHRASIPAASRPHGQRVTRPAQRLSPFHGFRNRWDTLTAPTSSVRDARPQPTVSL